MPDSSLTRSLLALLRFVVITYAVAGISSAFTVREIAGWYAGLAKPSFTPPNWIFGPVWTLLYTLMAVAAWRVWRVAPDGGGARVPQLYWVQLVLNFLWSILFFAAHRVGLAVGEIALLWLAIAATMIAFFRVDRWAGALFVPYLAWVSFAAVLNVAIWRLN